MRPTTARTSLGPVTFVCASLVFVVCGCASSDGGTGSTGHGGSTGGGAATGGSVGTGGVPGTGGSSSAGGSPGTGGSQLGTGGTLSPTGGSVGTGGTVVIATGGAGGTDTGSAGRSGGSEGGATSTGGGGSDGGPVKITPGGASKCPTGTAVLCDGFENAAPGAAGSDWSSAGSGVSVNTDPSKVYRGTKSLKITGSTNVVITETKTFKGNSKATNNALWGRMFFLSGVTAANGWAQGHTYFGALSSSPSKGDDFHFVGGSRAKLLAQIRLNNGDRYTDPSGKNGTGTEPGFPLADAGWQCWEWHVQPDDSYDFYINGTEVMEMKIVAGKASYGGATFSPMPVFGSLAIGWNDFGSGAPATLWIDEVAVGPDRIGCNN